MPDDGSDFREILAKASSPADLATLLIATPLGYGVGVLFASGWAEPGMFSVLFGSLCLGVKKLLTDVRDERQARELAQKAADREEYLREDRRREDRRERMAQLEAEREAAIRAASSADLRAEQLRTLLKEDLEEVRGIDREDDQHRQAIAGWLLLYNEVEDMVNLSKRRLVDEAELQARIAGVLSVRRRLRKELSLAAISVQGREVAIATFVQGDRDPSSIGLAGQPDGSEDVNVEMTGTGGWSPELEAQYERMLAEIMEGRAVEDGPSGSTSPS